MALAAKVHIVEIDDVPGDADAITQLVVTLEPAKGSRGRMGLGYTRRDDKDTNSSFKGFDSHSLCILPSRAKLVDVVSSQK